MPTKARQPCAHPGCPALVTSGRCPTHRPPDRRPTSTQRGYGQPWRRTSKAFLQAHPWCVDCGAPSTESDHAPRTRAELAADPDVDNPDAWEHLQPRCKPCHSRRTANTSSGWGSVQAP